MLRDIMVHLNGGLEDEVRLEHAGAIASATQTHVVGILTNMLPSFSTAIPLGSDGAAYQLLSLLQDKARQEGDVVFKRLSERLTQMQVASELRRLDEIFGSMAPKVAEHARCSDLFICIRPFGGTEEPIDLGLVEAVLFGSGRAIMLVPPGHYYPGPIRTILLAWNGSREAARALREGLPFIEQAERIIVLRVDPEDKLACDDVKSHLAWHGVHAEILTAESNGQSIANVILEKATTTRSDLVIMGGYGHTRLRECVFGGTTRDMLKHSNLRVLLAH